MASSGREQFLGRVKQALREGTRAGAAPTVPARGSVGYQGAGADRVARFCQELTQAGGQAHVVPDGPAATARVVELLTARGVRKVLLGGGRIEALGLAEHLSAQGMEVALVAGLDDRARLFAADAGVGTVDFLIAETGTVVLRSQVNQPRSLSLLPPFYVAIADSDQILPDLFDLYDRLDPRELPSCLSLITGPSKTGDIELKLVTGVHGPGEIHVVVISGSGATSAL